MNDKFFKIVEVILSILTTVIAILKRSFPDPIDEK